MDQQKNIPQQSPTAGDDFAEAPWREEAAPPPPARRPKVAFARIASLSLLFSVPLVVILAALVVSGMLSVVPALLASAVGVLLNGLMFRPLVGDWAAVAAYLRPEPGQGERSSPPPELRFSEGAREVAVAARSLRLRTTQALARARAEVQAREGILDSLPDPLMMMDEDGVIQRGNAAARALFDRQQLSGRPLTAVLRDPAVLDAFDRARTAGADGPDASQVLQVTLGATVERTFQVEIEHLGPEVPLDARVLMVLHDVTALVRAEQMRADFVANASHELRTPLTSVLGFVETLRGPARDDPEAQDRFLGIMYQQASRMKRLIEDLLSLSRIELREHTPPTNPVSVARVIDPVVLGLEIQAEDKEMTIEIEIPPTLPAVRGDKDELTQVFQNLISNGIKYGRSGTALTIRAEQPPRGPAQMPHSTRNACLVVHIIDRGEGIAKEHLPRLTERFYRVDTARSRQLGGTGLGLAIVKHIVNRHRGALLIDSTPGRGSVFSVYLPLAEAVAVEKGDI
jgi:two-component system phosphate regulon sensor histidine kinase PhoR